MDGDGWDTDDWNAEDPGLEPGDCPVGNIPHLLGSDPQGCLECRDAAARRGGARPRNPPDPADARRPAAHQPRYDRTADRRAIVTQGRNRARRLAAAAAAGEIAARSSGSAYIELGEAAVAACRRMARFLRDFPTDPVAAAMAAELTAELTTGPAATSTALGGEDLGQQIPPQDRAR